MPRREGMARLSACYPFQIHNACTFVVDNASGLPLMMAIRYVDMPITDILQMMGRAGRPQFDDSGTVCNFVAALSFRSNLRLSRRVY